ncbi:MAG: bifunctional oligoribonuclease/PAP phosphatase NrnA [Candidatus Koribacter versatilis]|uniref:Bifunctional oligoribonuclease/PAP phosphatase NrnA n=1 Tax=Candidatus Korobacter versatilis TaxID=658062 RepID=A0A932ABL0_9BACT|nr:bifunctional oligoribonuclease/PAP phosphatase NrnA [Candidatus Koribacter versatilis]
MGASLARDEQFGSLHAVLERIESTDRFVLTSHARPDGDAVGSVLGCWQVLEALGKKSEVVLADEVPFIYKRLPYADKIVHASRVNGSYDTAILLECDSIERSRLEGLEDRVLINIDHHVSGRPFGHINWIDPSACACAELVYRLAVKAGVKITPEMATCLYAAVLTDTGAFCFQGVNERTFALARELVRAGARPAEIAQQVYFAAPTSKMRLLGAALANLHREHALAWMHVTREQFDRAEAEDEDAEGLVNYALGIAGVEAAVFFREMEDGRFRVSLRSKGIINVAEIAEQFGGGGHACASGCAMDGPLSAASERILAQLRCALGDKVIG